MAKPKPLTKEQIQLAMRHTLSGCPVYPNSGCPKTISVSINTHPLSLRSSM